LAGGAHHTGFILALTADYLQVFAEIAGLELLEINQTTTVREFINELRWNEAFYQ